MRIGKIEIEKGILLAPMEDVTDLPFRLICKRFGADIVYTEFVNSEGLVRKSAKTHRKMEFLQEERPFGIQIYGGAESSMRGAAEMAAALRPDLIDINCGCWVKNVVGNGAGSALLKDPPRMERIVSSVVKAVDLPVTVKTRLGWDASAINIVELAKMLEQTGIAALTIHCRTRAQGHKGDPDFTWIPKVKREVAIPIIVNGGLDTPEKIRDAFTETGCDAAMVARGAIDNPWIFSQAKALMKDGSVLGPPTYADRINLLAQHLEFSVAYKGEGKAVTEFRKFYAGYLKGMPNSSKFRISLMPYLECAPILERLHQYLEVIQTTEHETTVEPGLLPE